MAKPTSLELYDKLVATNPDIERKGATVPYTSVNGNMFSYLSKEGKLELRLPPDEREGFLKKYNAKLCEAYGVVQKEYVEVPRFTARLDRQAEEVFRRQLRLGQFPQTESHHEEKEGLTTAPNSTFKRAP